MLIRRITITQHSPSDNQRSDDDEGCECRDTHNHGGERHTARPSIARDGRQLTIPQHRSAHHFAPAPQWFWGGGWFPVIFITKSKLLLL